MGMTNEEREIALYCLKASSDYHSEVCEECVKYPNCDHMIQDDVTETIIKALEQQPSEDCISREAVLETQAKYAEYIGATKFWQMRDDIRALPSVTPQPKVGKWISNKCDKCGASRPPLFDNYCPNCGAKMEVEE